MSATSLAVKREGIFEAAVLTIDKVWQDTPMKNSDCMPALHKANISTQFYANMHEMKILSYFFCTELLSSERENYRES